MLASIRLVIIVAALVSLAAAQDVAEDKSKIPWKLTVVMLDGVDPFNQGEVPVKEAVSLIESNTRFAFDVRYINEFSPHDLTPYATGEDYDGDGKGDEWAYLMMSWNLPDSVLNSLPESSSYLLLYRLNGYRPLQAGSALPMEYPLYSRGKPYPYASVPTDQWWYVNEPYEGFESRAAQVLTHEIVNTIQAKIEAAPYNCKPLIIDYAMPAAKYEAARLEKISDTCYAKLSSNSN